MPRRVVHAAEVRPAWVPCRRQSFESSYFGPKNGDATGDGWRCGLGNGSGRVDQTGCWDGLPLRMSLHFRHLLSYVIENTSAVIWFITRGARLCILLNGLSNPAFVLSNGVRLLIKTLRVWAGAWSRRFADKPGVLPPALDFEQKACFPFSRVQRAQPMRCGSMALCAVVGNEGWVGLVTNPMCRCKRLSISRLNVTVRVLCALDYSTLKKRSNWNKGDTRQSYIDAL